MNDLVRSMLESRLNAPLNRRRFVQGAGGLATMTVLGGSGAAQAQKVGGELNFLGWDGEHAGNVAKDFLALPMEELLRLRHVHEHCGHCQAFGLHRLDIDVLLKRYATHDMLFPL